MITTCNQPAFWEQACAERRRHPVAPWTDEERYILADYNQAAGCGEQTLRHIDALGNSQTLAVVTGQQPGIFLTPLYILFKSIAAIRWAQTLADWLHRPVVPVFWIASDDHDFEEIRHACFLNREGALQTWVYEPPPLGKPEQRSEGRSSFDIGINLESLDGFLQALADNTHPTEFKAAILARWRSLALESENLEDYFARLMHHCLGDSGLILLPARLEPLRKRGRAILQREIEHPGRSSCLVKQAGERMKASGDSPALHRRGDEANFFLYRQGIRCKVSIEGSTFLIQHPQSGDLLGQVDEASLLAELESNPSHFSPNVALRPVVQDAALPTIAMVAGPGERRYLRQLAEVYEDWRVWACPVLARPRALLVEPRMERQIAKYGITPQMLESEDWSAMEHCFLSAGSHAGALAAVDGLRSALAAAIEQAQAKMGTLAVVPSMQSALQKTQAQIHQAIEALSKRVHAEALLAADISTSQYGKFQAALHPLGKPQERVFGPLAPFLINHGDQFSRWLMEKLRVDTESVQIMYLSSMIHSDKSE